MEGMNLRNVNDPSHKSSRSKLGKCQGDCDSDSQCKPGLKCFQRSGYTKVPGCEGRGKKHWDYCRHADLIESPKPKMPVWARGKGKEEVVTEKLNLEDLLILQKEDILVKIGWTMGNPTLQMSI